MSIQFINSTKILRALKECPEKMEKVIAEQLDKTAELIVAEAKRLAPEDTGALKESIKKTKTTAKNGRIRVKVFADYPKGKGVRKTKTKKQAKGSRVYYAFAVEYGTKKRNPKYPVQPFFGLAARKYGGEELARRITSNMDLVLEKEFRK